MRDRAAEVLVLDGPTTGLHMDDVDRLVDLMSLTGRHSPSGWLSRRRSRWRRGVPGTAV